MLDLPMLDLVVIDDPAAATTALDPVRRRLLAELAVPASAAALAVRLRLPRQKVNYHLRALEAHGLVHVADTRRWGGLTERLVVASAASYIVSPSVLGPSTLDARAPHDPLDAHESHDPTRGADRLSASYLIALAARCVREAGALLRRSRETGQRLATMSIDTEIRFRSAADRAAFSRDLTDAVTTLVARYHDPSASGGRAHRLAVIAYPAPDPTPDPKEERS